MTSYLTLRQAFRSVRKKVSFWKQRRLPNLRRLISTAYEIGELEGYEAAVAWAERHDAESVLHGINILRANRDKADTPQWLDHVNAYVARHDVSLLSLREAPGSLVHRLASTPRNVVAEGPLISVIMCAYNAQATIEMAARSILDQSWRPLELLIVDDQSTDDTARIAFRLAREDARVRVHLNAVNVGPYVGRNLALGHAKGQYITCHDADDWAHPERLENQLAYLRREQLAGALSAMLRMRADGQFARLTRARGGGADGVVQPAYVSAFFERKAFDDRLQYWDSVRFGADSELFHRAEMAFQRRVKRNLSFSMICLEHGGSLTSHPETGISEKGGLSDARIFYSSEYKAWHATASSNIPRMEFPLLVRRFKAPDQAYVPFESISCAISQSRMNTRGAGV